MELTKEQINQFKAKRLDIENPSRPQESIYITSFEDEDEDENTVAKSIVDEIIEQTGG